MENNTIHPDEMDRLLRETFLESEFPETDSITELMAKQAFTTSWPAVPPVSKELGFVAKKGFFAGFSLNTLLISMVLATGLGIAGITYLFSEKTQNTPPETAERPVPASVQTLTVPELILTPVVEPIAVAPTLAKHKNRLSENPAQTQPIPAVDSGKSQRSINDQVKLPPGKPRRARYILVPDISPQEAAANEKRKQEMLRQVIKVDKKEWAYIPMGTTHLNGKPVSIQAFYMQTHEVSNIQYKTYLYDLVLNNRLLEYRRAAVYDSAWMSYPGMESLTQLYFWHPKYNEYPVVNVSPEGALLYSIWLTNEVNKELGHKTKINDIRLPTEEEWIYAARADDDSALYAWHGQFVRNVRGAFLANFYSSTDQDGAEVTAPVTAYPPNDWGLYNLCGNAAEMTRSTDDASVVVKGGSWSQPAEYMQLLHQNRMAIDKLPLPTVGFRTVYTFLQTP